MFGNGERGQRGAICKRARISAAGCRERERIFGLIPFRGYFKVDRLQRRAAFKHIFVEQAHRCVVERDVGKLRAARECLRGKEFDPSGNADGRQRRAVHEYAAFDLIQ